MRNPSTARYISRVGWCKCTGATPPTALSLTKGILFRSVFTRRSNTTGLLLVFDSTLFFNSSFNSGTFNDAVDLTIIMAGVSVGVVCVLSSVGVVGVF